MKFGEVLLRLVSIYAMHSDTRVHNFRKFMQITEALYQGYSIDRKPNYSSDRSLDYFKTFFNLFFQNLVMVSIQSLIRRVPTEVFAEINSIPGTTVRSIQRPQHHQLYCRTGYHLIITPHGAVRGTRDQYNSYSKC